MNFLLSDDKLGSLDKMESNLSLSAGGLYVHIPFCRKKCLYCDFYSVGERKADWHRFVDSLLLELQSRAEELPHTLKTIYFGGGTPSLMPSDEFRRLCEALAPLADDVVEFTLEANPDDVTVEKLSLWKECGVDRLSIGLQSFNDDVLKAIGRRHTSDEARNACLLAGDFFQNISIDLIFGLPGQSVRIWEKDVEEAVRLHPQHISCYSLMYEPGTPITFLRDKGNIDELSESDSEKMYDVLVNSLQEAGFDHYEISNFALPGYRSIHNSSYWHQYPYLGIGPSAHSYDGLRCRSANKPDLCSYVNFWNAKDLIYGKDNNILVREILSDTELKEEYIMTSLRIREGISINDFRGRFGSEAAETLIEKCRKWIDDGSLVSDNGRIFIAENSLLISDSIIVDLI